MHVDGLLANVRYPLAILIVQLIRKAFDIWNCETSIMLCLLYGIYSMFYTAAFWGKKCLIGEMFKENVHLHLNFTTLATTHVYVLLIRSSKMFASWVWYLTLYQNVPWTGTNMKLKTNQCIILRWQMSVQNIYRVFCGRY
jgi:hypothetical protein